MSLNMGEGKMVTSKKGSKHWIGFEEFNRGDDDIDRKGSTHRESIDRESH